MLLESSPELIKKESKIISQETDNSKEEKEE
jgi:hypothetical protein